MKVTGAYVLTSIEETMRKAGVRKLEETQRMVIAGALEVWLEKAKHEAAAEVYAIVKGLIAPLPAPKRPIARWSGENSLRARLKSAGSK